MPEPAPDSGVDTTPKEASRFRYFVAISPGLEDLLQSELRRLGIEGQTTAGGVECTGPISTLWELHRSSRLAESVRLRLRPFEAAHFGQLELGLERLPWHAYLRPGDDLRLSVTCQGSRLYHSDAVAERTERAIRTRLGSPRTGPAAPRDEPLPSADCSRKIHIRVVRNVVQVSIDASGERLHRRGYRTHVGKAPLRETLAAATIELLFARSSNLAISSLWDPCCGSGTLLAEWLERCLEIPPRSARHYAFESWPTHDPTAYSAWMSAHRLPQPLVPDCQAYGSDRDASSIAAARSNLTRANVLDRCHLLPLDFRDAVHQIPKYSAVVANLPYGVRLQDRKAAVGVFLALDSVLATRRDLRPGLVLSVQEPPGASSCRWQRLATFSNGGLRVSAWAVEPGS